MIIGNGMLARRFSDYANNNTMVILASGVADSHETRSAAFKRELDIVSTAILKYPNKVIIYFSTSSMYDPMLKDSLYVEHKLNIENYIKQYAQNYHIFRISQIIGKASNQTLVNFLINHVLNDEPFTLWQNATRNLISLNDVFHIIDLIIQNNLFINETINIANPYNIRVTELLDAIEKATNKKSLAEYANYGSPFDHIDISRILPLIKQLAIPFENKAYYLNAIKEIL